MLVVWAAYILSISTVLVALAWLWERTLRRRKRITRFVWAGAVVGSILSPLLGGILITTRDYLLARNLDLARAVGTPDPTVLYSLGDVLANTRIFGLHVDVVFLIGWMAMASCAAIWIWLSKRTVTTLSASWAQERWRGQPVYVSKNVGPCVVGFLQSRLVVPEWVGSLTERQQDLILEHELQHLRAWDPRLSQLFLGLICLMPWNLPLLIAYRRLRLAIEIDCDHRVVEQTGSVREYGKTLLEAQSKVPRHALGLLRRSELEHRIRSLTGEHSGWVYLQDGLVIFGATAALLAFLLLPVPRTEVFGLKTILGSATPQPLPYDVRPQLVSTESFQQQRSELQALARERNTDSGKVTFLLHITNEGIVSRAILGISSGDVEVDELAREIALATDWKPARKDGHVTDVWLNFRRLRWAQAPRQPNRPP